MRYLQVQVIGGKGSAKDQFRESLRSLCVDGQGRLYAAGDSEIKVFDGGGKLQNRWSTAGPVSAVALSGGGAVFAGQAGLIEIFDGAGKRQGAWRNPEQLADVTAIGFSGGDVLAADARSRSIRRLDGRGALTATIGKDNRTNGFLIPNGVLDFCVDARGIIHAANPGKHRVERYTREGQLLGHIGRFDGVDPSGFPGCCNPTNVALDPAGRIYVTEKAGPRAKVLAPDGALLAVIAAGEFDPNCKNMDIAVDRRGRVYVAETVKLHILVFEPVPEAAE
jgi:sugar lactone lactonase YvrE